MPMSARCDRNECYDRSRRVGEEYQRRVGSRTGGVQRSEHSCIEPDSSGDKSTAFHQFFRGLRARGRVLSRVAVGRSSLERRRRGNFLMSHCSARPKSRSGLSVESRTVPSAAIKTKPTRLARRRARGPNSLRRRR